MERFDTILENNAVVTVLFALVGLLVAGVTFGILNSQAAGQFHGYQLGGALAGFAVTFLLLTTFYKQVTKSSNEPEKLREQIEANQQKYREQIEVLQQKLLRGSPRPPGFEVEISEQQKIVLARPEGWQKRGGVMFDFQLVSIEDDDNYPAHFTGSYVPITETYKSLGMEEFYRIFVENIRKNKLNSYLRGEYTSIGGESHRGVKSIRVIASQYMRLEFYKNPYGGKPRMEPFQIPEDEYKANIQPPPQSSAAESPLDNEHTPAGLEPRIDGRVPIRIAFAEISHMFVACYHEDLKCVFFFEFMDDEKNFFQSSHIFNRVLSSTRFLN